ncbi:hypothetical protein PILCRDRAFT_817274, partial [Piloderma croceum F 1598]
MVAISLQKHLDDDSPACLQDWSGIEDLETVIWGWRTSMIGIWVRCTRSSSRPFVATVWDVPQCLDVQLKNEYI